ncbi:hypothetical protein EV421DRAFT_2018113 [Armillaria borealis]|uniref:F-box domain-containing protein n=1 Tax=Armillaria borealis TaxID=47425 RepID=A0AA39JNG9_9AGAR|nr:hypothetical protein EV421DRAFT_2018113 [Armillaria borealis]
MKTPPARLSNSIATSLEPEGRFVGSGSNCPDCGFTSTERPALPGLAPSRMAELFSSNDPPIDPIELAILEAIVRDGDSYLSVLQQRISATRETLEALLKEQALHVKRVADAKALLNPVRGLPQDVLIEIFTACIPNRIEIAVSNEFDCLDTKSAPWVLSQVCASWRCTALATAKLWSCIGLSMDRYANHTKYVFRFGILLARSGSHPLMVSIYASADIARHPLLAMILPTSSRWTSLSVTALLCSFVLFNNISHSLPLLEFLGIHATTFGAPLENSRAVWGFQHAPRLQRLLVEVLGIMVTEPFLFSRQFILPEDSRELSRLFALTTPLDAAYLLQWHGARNVVNSRLWIVGTPVSEQGFVVPMIRHACLRDLTVTETASRGRPGSSAKLISQLQLPVLRSLTLSYKNPTAIMPAIRQGTVPALTHLHLLAAGLAIDGNAVIEMLKWTPGLTYLKLVFNFKTADIFIALRTVNDETFELIPRLHTLFLTGAQFDFKDHDFIITEMVVARRELVEEASLRVVCLNEGLGDGERWDRLRHDGLENCVAV